MHPYLLEKAACFCKSYNVLENIPARVMQLQNVVVPLILVTYSLTLKQQIRVLTFKNATGSSTFLNQNNQQIYIYEYPLSYLHWGAVHCGQELVMLVCLSVG